MKMKSYDVTNWNHIFSEQNRKGAVKYDSMHVLQVHMLKPFTWYNSRREDYGHVYGQATLPTGKEQKGDNTVVEVEGIQYRSRRCYI